MSKEYDGYNRVLKIVKNGEVTQRTCLGCKAMKPLSEFPNDTHGYLGKMARCKPCIKIKRKNAPKDKRGWGYKNRPDRVFRTYGVTYEHVVNTLESQFGLCGNVGCGKEIFLGIKNGHNIAVIDHDHATGKFRGVLCTVCNMLLGKIENDRNQTLGLLKYLTKHREIPKENSETSRSMLMQFTQPKDVKDGKRTT